MRAPAAANGTTGLKVSHGRVPKNGVVPLGYSLDGVAPLARSARGCALLMEVMAGDDTGDPDAAAVGVPAYAQQLTGDVTGLRVGVPVPYFLDAPGTSEETRRAVLDVADRLRALGAVVTETEVRYAREATSAVNVTWMSEGYAFHRNDLRTRWETYGASYRDIQGRAALFAAHEYVQAQRVRHAFRAEMAKAWSMFDVLLTPTIGATAPRIDEMDMMAVLFGHPAHTMPWNLVGLPACAAPCGPGDSGLPLSFQIVGQAFDEATVLRAVDAVQRGTDWHLPRATGPGAGGVTARPQQIADPDGGPDVDAYPLTIDEAAAALRAGRVSSVELTTESLRRIEAPRWPSCGRRTTCCSRRRRRPRPR